MKIHSQEALTSIYRMEYLLDEDDVTLKEMLVRIIKAH